MPVWQDVVPPPAGMTAGRVEVAASALQLVDYANFTYDGNKLTIGTTLDVAAAGTLTLGPNTNNLTFSNATQNWIQWPAVGVGAPTFTTRSVGTRLVLYPNISGVSLDYGIGIEGAFLWLSSANGFKFYGNNATTALSQINGAGAYLATAGNVALDTIAVGALSIGTSTATSIVAGNSANTLWDMRSQEVLVRQQVVSSGTPAGALVVSGALHTGLSAAEALDVNFSLNRTVTFAGSATPGAANITLQRAIAVQAPTYAFGSTGAQVISDAVTLEVLAAPSAGANATITNTWALRAFGNVQLKSGGGTGILQVDDVVGARMAYASNTATITSSAAFTIQQAAAVGTLAGFRYLGGTLTNLTASTEYIDFNVNMSHSVQFATGPLTIQRFAVFQAPTVSAVGASTITTAATLAVTGPPIASTNVTITGSYPLWVQSGTSRFDGPVATGADNTNQLGSSGNRWSQIWCVSLFANAIDVSSSTVLTIGASTANTITVGRGAATTLNATIGTFNVTQSALAALGNTPALTITAGAHTNMTLSTEVNDVNINLARTVQWATGAIALQRAIRVQAPTYAFVGASTITTAATFAITGPPAAGTNATITNSYALWVQTGKSTFEWAGVGGANTTHPSLSLQNNTASTAGVPVQGSPGLEFVSHEWNTGGAADGINSIYLFTQALSNAAPAPQLWFYSRQDSAAYAAAGYIQPYSGTMYIADATNTSGVTVSNTQINLYSGGSQLTVNSAQAIGSSPSSAGYFSANDSVGTSLVYSSNNIIIDSVNIVSTIGGAGSFEIIHNGSGTGLAITMGASSLAGFSVTPGGLTVYRPEAVFYDSSGDLRYGVDYIGFPSLGSLYTIYEDWCFNLPGALSQVSPIAGNGRWSLTFFNASSGYLIGTSPSGYAPPTVQITCGSTSGASKSFLGTTRAVVQAANSLVIVTVECDFSMATIGANGFDVYVGLTSNRDFTTASPTTVGGVYFMKRTGDTQWQCVFDNGTSRTITASGVTPVANTANTLKIDWFGSATYQGAFAVFWIDGVRVATISTNSYSGAAFFSAGAKNASSGSTMAMQLGIVQLMFNRFNAPPLPS